MNDTQPHPTSRIAIEIDAGVSPISGRLWAGDNKPHEFEGMIELIALLDWTRARIPGADFDPSGSEQDPVDP